MLSKNQVDMVTFWTTWYVTIQKNGKMEQFINPSKKKCNLLYLKTQSVPRSKHFPPRL